MLASDLKWLCSVTKSSGADETTPKRIKETKNTFFFRYSAKETVILISIVPPIKSEVIPKLKKNRFKSIFTALP